MKPTFYAVAISVALANCSASQDYQSNARRKISERLSDPDSLKLRNVTTRSTGEIHLLCGEFNAKNKFGGYVGYVPFSFVKEDNFEHANWDENPDRKAQFLAECLSQSPSSALKDAQEFHKTLERLKRGEF